MRTVHAVILLFAILAWPSSSRSEETARNALSQTFESLVCNETLYACSDSTTYNCNALSTQAIEECDWTQLEQATDAAIDDSGPEEVAAMEAQAIGICFISKFRLLAADEGISDECVNDAVSVSIEKAKAEARESVENRK